jgi:hypothetical protein
MHGKCIKIINTELLMTFYGQILIQSCHISSNQNRSKLVRGGYDGQRSLLVARIYHSVLVSVHRRVLNTFRGTTNLKSLHSGQQLQFKLQSCCSLKQ